jgi:hypothetical protein
MLCQRGIGRPKTRGYPSAYAAIAKATEEMKEINLKEQAIQRLLGGGGQTERIADAIPLDEAVALGELETDAILGALRGNPDSRKNVGPRSVRSLLFQYQLRDCSSQS